MTLQEFGLIWTKRSLKLKLWWKGSESASLKKTRVKNKREIKRSHNWESLCSVDC